MGAFGGNNVTDLMAEQLMAEMLHTNLYNIRVGPAVEIPAVDDEVEKVGRPTRWFITTTPSLLSLPTYRYYPIIYIYINIINITPSLQ